METEIKIKKTPLVNEFDGKRESKDLYYLRMADIASGRATCLRRSFGAVIVNKYDTPISTGYCGSPRGTLNCIDIEICYRQQNKIPSGQRYELCRSVHAEQNAMLHTKRDEMVGGTMYISGRDLEKDKHPRIVAMPCEICVKEILNSGLEKIVTMDDEFKYEILTSDIMAYARENPMKPLSLYEQLMAVAKNGI